MPCTRTGNEGGMKNEEGPSREFLIQENLFLLEQGRHVLGMISAEHYTRCPQELAVDSSPGRHFRHVLNFYQKLLSSSDGSTNYEQRVRDAHIENDSSRALHLVDELRATLRHWLEESDSCPKLEKIAFTGRNGIILQVSSCLERELKAVADHTLHHYALIALLLRNWGYVLPQEFGIASSTPLGGD